MTEVPLPESAQRRPEPMRIFTGARLKSDGSFVSPAHQALYELWKHEVDRRHLPGILRSIPTKIKNETRISLRITPDKQENGSLLETIRNRFEKGVKAWVRDGEPKFLSIDEFRAHYIPTKE